MNQYNYPANTSTVQALCSNEAPLYRTFTRWLATLRMSLFFSFLFTCFVHFRLRVKKQIHRVHACEFGALFFSAGCQCVWVSVMRQRTQDTELTEYTCSSSDA